MTPEDRYRSADMGDIKMVFLAWNASQTTA